MASSRACRTARGDSLRFDLALAMAAAALRPIPSNAASVLRTRDNPSFVVASDGSALCLRFRSLVAIARIKGARFLSLDERYLPVKSWRGGMKRVE